MHRSIRFARIAARWAGVCLPTLLGACGASHDVVEERPRYVDPPIVDKTLLIPATYGRLQSATEPGPDPRGAMADPRFYFARTMLTSPRGAFTGVSRASPLRVVRFDVTEDFLLVRAVPESFERNVVVGHSTDPLPSLGGDILAAYRIATHFDVPRAAAATDGTAAAADTRPWFQRRYMRVDWSQNLVRSADSRYVDLVDVPSEPLPPAGGTDPLAAAQFASDLSWFDIPERVLLHPEHARLSTAAPAGFDACELLDHDRSQPCAPVEVSYRVSFLRRGREREMMPAVNGAPSPGAPANLVDDRFPVIAADHIRVGESLLRIGARRDLFVRDHFVTTAAPSDRVCDTDRDCRADEVCSIGSSNADGAHRGSCAVVLLDHSLDPEANCTTDADCRPDSPTARCDAGTHTCGEPFVRCSRDSDCTTHHALSTCDIGIALERPDNLGLCTAPVRSRTVQPIAIHLAADTPPDLDVAARRAVDDWNAALQRAVVRARRRECQLEELVDGADPSSDSEPRCNDPRVLGVGPGGDAERIVVACHSPVWGVLPGPGSHTVTEVADAHAHGFDLEVCGPQGTIAVAGDIRFDTISSSAAPSDELLWTSVNADPFDGRIVGAQASISFAQLDELANVWSGRYRYLLGDVADDYRSIDPFAFNALSGPIVELPFVRAGTRERMRQAFVPLSDGSIYVPPGADVAPTILEDRFAVLNATPLGTRVLDPALSQLVTVGSDVATSELSRLASPLGGERADVRVVRRTFQRRAAGSECGLRYTRGDVALDPAIERLASLTPVVCSDEPDLCVDGPPPPPNSDRAAVQAYARLRLARGVFTHAIGHLLGLPHNLAGSADALNYPDRYWQVRGHGHGQGIEPRYVSLGRVDEGRYDSDEERAHRNEFVTSSIMDLLDPHTASAGVGRADVAALASLYTRTVEAFRAVGDEIGFAQHAAVSARRGTFSAIDLSHWQQAIAHRIHYDQIPGWFAHNPGGTPAIGDAARFVVLANETSSEAVMGWGDPVVANRDIADHWLVPYRAIAEDEGVTGWPAIAFDRGGDEFESAHSLAQRWIDGNGYDTWNAGARHVTPFGHLDDVRTRFVEPLRSIAAASIPSAQMIHVYGHLDTARTDEDDVGIASAALVMNTLLGQLSIPDAAQYSLGAALDGTPRFVRGGSPSLQAGRFIDSQFAPDGTLDRVGSWFDKLAAIDGVNDTIESIHHPTLPVTIDADLFTLFPGAALRFAGGMLADDLADVGPLVRTTSIRFPDVMSLAAFPGPGPAENGRGGTDGLTPIDPGIRDSHAALMDAHQLARWSILGDRAFARFAAVWIDDERAVPDEPTVSFSDALTGRTYRAFHISGAPGGEAESVGYSAMLHASTGGVSDEAGVAARAILHLQDLASVRDRATNGVYRSRVDHALRDAIDRLEAFRTAQRALESR